MWATHSVTVRNLNLIPIVENSRDIQTGKLRHCAKKVFVFVKNGQNEKKITWL